MEDYKVIPMIGELAPEFHAVTTQGEIHFPQDYQGKWVVLFSHSADFTPVCTTEFMTFASMIREFKAIGAELLGLSIDSVYSHIAWVKKMKELSWKDLKHLDISFPVIADTTMEIAKSYGMVHISHSISLTVRAVFIIDPEGKIRAISYYPASTGRNINEIKRLVIALQKTDSDNVSTPANWLPSEDVLLFPPQTCGLATERIEKVNENIYALDWFMCFQQSNAETVVKKTEPEANPFPSMYPPRGRNRYGR